MSSESDKPAPVFTTEVVVDTPDHHVTVEREGTDADGNMFYWRSNECFGGALTREEAIYFAGWWCGRRALKQDVEDAMQRSIDGRTDDWPRPGMRAASSAGGSGETNAYDITPVATPIASQHLPTRALDGFPIGHWIRVVAALRRDDPPPRDALEAIESWRASVDKETP